MYHILCEDASRPRADDHVTKSRNRKLIRVTSSMNVLSISVSISVTIADIWTNFGTEHKCHTIITPEWSIHITWKYKMPASAILDFWLCEIKNASSSGMDKDICIKFYGIMHWTLAYTTACTTVQAVITVWTVVTSLVSNLVVAVGLREHLKNYADYVHRPIRTTYPEQRNSCRNVIKLQISM